MEQTEAELEKFRKAWKEEVTAKLTHGQQASSSTSTTSAPKPRRNQEPKATSSGIVPDHILEPNSYHDADEREHSGHRLGADGDPFLRSTNTSEPNTALEHYERAVENEGQGNLGGAVNHYRRAFKLDAEVQDKYKTKHFSNLKPNSSAAPSSTAPTTQPNIPLGSLKDLIASFSQLSILGASPPTEFSPAPTCPIAQVPDEILVDILLHIADVDAASFIKLSQVCKRLAFLVLAEDKVWRRICHGQKFGFTAMHYDFACEVNGSSLSEFVPTFGRFESLRLNHARILGKSPSRGLDATATVVTIALPEESSPTSLVPLPSLIHHLPLTSTYPTYRSMFRSRPRIRFNGCYISTVNYNRPGMVASNSYSWNAPILIVTYYRYLRFFRDGTVISLLSTSPPGDVVAYLRKDYMSYPHQGSSLPQAVMKDALPGRWRMTGDLFGEKARKAAILEQDYEDEVEGDVIVETEGVVPKYMYKMHLGLGSAGKTTRNNKLNWKTFWNYNKLTDDWGEFMLSNYKPFHWSRVTSYGTGL